MESEENSVIIKGYRADGTIHATVNGDEKKFWADKFYFLKLKSSKDPYRTLTGLARRGNCE